VCFHDKPTRNDEEGRANPPPAQDGEEILFDECGRCRPRVSGKDSLTDYHSHHFRIVRGDGPVFLLARHGGGDERVDLGHANATRVVELLALLPDSDVRYLTINMLYVTHVNAKSAATKTEGTRWRQAAVDKRIKMRRRQGLVDVWIE
jgi:hypothetical protein